MQNHPTFKYLFLSLDITILTLSLFFTLPRSFFNVDEFSAYSLPYHIGGFSCYLLLLVICLFAFRYNNLYKRNVITARFLQFKLVLKSLLCAGPAVAILMVALDMNYFMTIGKTKIFYFTLYSLVLFASIRAGAGKNIFRFLTKKNICQINVLVVGGDEAGQYVAKTFINDSFHDFNIVGFVDDYKKAGSKIMGPFYNLGNLEDLEKILEYHKVDEVLIAIDNAPYPRLIRIVESCLKTGKHVRVYSNLFKVVAERLDVEFYSSIPLVSLPQHPVDGKLWKNKRIQDVFLSATGILLLLPVFLAIMVGIKLSSPGPVFFKQTRIGKRGKAFDFYKFRSMHPANDNSRHKAYVQHFIKATNSCEQKDMEVFKIKDDPRIFKFGKFIRKTSLDEFPQLYNVFKGDMTLVGPRPCLPYEWECYEPWHKERLKSLPGCTGIWQAMGRSSVSFEEMVLLDIYYISNVSFWLDIKIILKTVPVIFLGKGGF